MAFFRGYDDSDDDDYVPRYRHNFLTSIWTRALLQEILDTQKERSKLNQSIDACQEDIPVITCDLSQQLSTHFNNPQFSDVTLRVKTKVYHVHKLILCAWSEVFLEMLSADLKQGKTSVKLVAPCKIESDGICTVLTMKETDERAQVFEYFLKFMYTESVDLNDRTVYPMFQLAKTYNVKDLGELCQDFLIQNVSDDTTAVQKYLGKATRFGMTQLYDHCINVLERNFGFIPELCVIEMNPELFVKIIGSSKLVVTSELHVLLVVFKWLTADGKEERRKHTETVLFLVRFAHILPADLKVASSHLLNSSKMYPKFKSIFQKLLHEAFEWHALSVDDVFTKLPYHIQFSSFSRNFVPLRYYISETTESYSELLLKVHDEETPSVDTGFSRRQHPPLCFVLMCVTQNNICNVYLDQDQQWVLDGVAFFDQDAKLWGIRYQLQPASRHCKIEHAEKGFHAAILTLLPRSSRSKPIVSTFEGVIATFGDEQKITVTLSPELLGLKSKPHTVNVKVVFFLKLSQSGLTNLKLRKPEEIPRSQPALHYVSGLW